MKKAGAVLGPMLKSLGIESGVRLQRIRRDWTDIFEQSISSHIYPSSISGKELLINVDSPIWMQQLTYYKKQIIQKLSAYGVSEIRFRLGKVTPPFKKTEEQKKIREITLEETAFIENMVSGIKNNELRESIKKTVSKSFSRSVESRHH